MSTTGTMKYLTIGDATYEVYNTDTEVVQTYVAASGYTNWRPLVVGYSSNSSETTAPTTTTGITYTFNTIKVKPSNGTIRFGAAALYNGDYTTTISADTLTAARTVTVPDKSGVIALTSDIPNLTEYAPLASPAFTGTPTAPTPLSGASDTQIATVKYVQDSIAGAGTGTGTVTSVGVANATNGGLSISGSPITNSGTISVGHSNVLASAQTTSGIYPIKIDKNGHISEYGNAVSIPSISLNGSSTTSPSFYAPTSVGTYGYVLKSNGNGAPTWTSATLTDEKVKTTPTTLDVLNGYLTFSSSATETTNTLNKHSSIQIAIDADTVINGQTQLTLGNTIVEGDSGAKIGVLELYGPNQYMVRLTPDTLTDTRLIKLPNKAGTIALTSDIPTVPTIYLNDAPATLYSFYAPTTAGTSGYYLKSNGSGAPTWAAAPTIPSNNVTGSGSIDYLARWSGTNTLSSTSLSMSTSYNSSSDPYGTIKLYIGSTGQIDWKGELVFYDGSGSFSKTITITPPSLTASRALTLPDKTGTIALTSDITDEKLAVVEVTSGTTYYPIVGTGASAATRQYDTTGFKYSANSIRSFITLGNNISEGTTGSKRGAIQIYGTADRYTQLETLITSTGAGQNTGVVVYFPDKGGTVALTSDIPTVPTITLNGSSTTSPSFYAPTSAGTSGYYLKSNGSGAPTWAAIPAGVTVTLNGSTTTTPSFYAPTTAGTSGQVLTSNGSGAPTWSAISDEIFIAEYNSTTYADILAAYNAGKTIILKEVYSSATTYYAYLEKYTDNTFYFATPIDENNNNKAIYTYTIGSSISSDGSVYLDIPSISLNGISTTSASFYAPTTAGTSGQVLTSNGSGAPTWAAAQSGSSVQIIRWT